MATESRPSPPTSLIDGPITEQGDNGDRHEHKGTFKRKSPTFIPCNEAEDPVPKRRRTDDSRSPGHHDDRESHDRYRRRRDSNSPRRRDYSVPEASGPLSHDRRKAVSQEEKKRGQRLFGGLLSTLSQKSNSAHQIKRQEIEKRQQERAEQRKVENEKHRAERLVRVKSIRQVEQVKLDEEMMHGRHRNALATAHYLKTRCEPPVYYLPYELTKEQQSTIDENIRKAETMVNSEVESFKRRKAERLNGSNHNQGCLQSPTTDKSATIYPPTAGETQKPNRGSPIPSPHSDITNEKADVTTTSVESHGGENVGPGCQTQSLVVEATSKSSVPAMDHADDGSADVLVEAEEDTVIY